MHARRRQKERLEPTEKAYNSRNLPSTIREFADPQKNIVENIHKINKLIQ